MRLAARTGPGQRPGATIGHPKKPSGSPVPVGNAALELHKPGFVANNSYIYINIDGVR